MEGWLSQIVTSSEYVITISGDKGVYPMTINVPAEKITGKIYLIRGTRVMLDSDLAEIYGVETKVFNQAVKRNEARFPKTFRFQLTINEYKALRSQFVTLKNSTRGQHRKYDKTSIREIFKRLKKEKF